MYETRISVAVEEDTAAFTKMLDKGTNNVKKNHVALSDPHGFFLQAICFVLMFHNSSVDFFTVLDATKVFFNLLQRAAFGFGNEFEGE